MKNKIVVTWIIMILSFAIAENAAAYVGPGAGLSLLGALWGLLLAVIAALGFVIMWPLRRMRKRAKEKREAAAANESREEPV
jgi:membrane protein implicated in regulation of membrane protease activity